MDKDTQEKMAKSLTAESTALLPYLPYLLQDLWELGSNPAEVAFAVKDIISADWNVLDLGCGKGAVSIRLARDFGCHTRGIDLMDSFIEYARNKADETGAGQLCSFEIGDIIEAAERETGYDLVVLGAVSGVMGTPAQTAETLKKTIKPGGYIIIDDGYLEEGAQELRLEGEYYTHSQWLKAFTQAGLKLVSERKAGEEAQSVNDSNTAAIAARAAELSVMHPEQRGLFEDYVAAQQRECDDMTDNLASCMWLLRRA